MTRIAVRRGLLVVALLGCAACAGKTFTFTTKFDSSGCPTESVTDVANCPSHHNDCVYVSKKAKDRVRFVPPGTPKDPTYSVFFKPPSNLKTTPTRDNDGKHWDLPIPDDTPEIEHRFGVTSDACPGKPLDPIVIVGP